MKRFKDLTIHLTISFHWRHFPIFIQSLMIQYWHSKKALFHFTPQKQWCDLKTSKETTLCINCLSIDIRLNSENREPGSIKESSTPTSFFSKCTTKMVEISPKVARMAKHCPKFQNHVVWKHGKSHYSLHLFSVGARLKQRPVGANVNFFSSLQAPNTYLLHRPYSSPRTMDARWGNRLYCTAKNSLPLPNF